MPIARTDGLMVREEEKEKERVTRGTRRGETQRANKRGRRNEKLGGTRQATPGIGEMG